MLIVKNLRCIASRFRSKAEIKVRVGVYNYPSRLKADACLAYCYSEGALVHRYGELFLVRIADVVGGDDADRECSSL